MNAISVSEDVYPNISEIYAYAENVFVVQTKNHRTIKVIVAKIVRCGMISKYYAFYEKLQTIELNGQTYEIWSVANLPWADGKTVEECMRTALHFVNEVGKQRQE